MTRAATVTPDWLRERGFTADLRTGKAVRLTPSQRRRRGRPAVAASTPSDAHTVGSVAASSVAREIYNSGTGAGVSSAAFGSLRAERPEGWNSGKSPEASRSSPRYRSKLEAAYAVVLDARLRAGELAAWHFEAITLKLADGVRYTPDFLVDIAAGRLELHEVKGHMRDDARIKLRVAARMFPMFTFVLVTRDQSGWRFENVRA